MEYMKVVQKTLIWFGKCEGTAPKIKIDILNGWKRFPCISFTLHSVFLHSRNFCGYLAVFVITKSKLASEEKSECIMNGNRFPCVFEDYNKIYASFNWNINTCFVFFCILRCLCRDKAIMSRKKMPFNAQLKFPFLVKIM